jgi:hypothetical protein
VIGYKMRRSGPTPLVGLLGKKACVSGGKSVFENYWNSLSLIEKWVEDLLESLGRDHERRSVILQ